MSPDDGRVRHKGLKELIAVRLGVLKLVNNNVLAMVFVWYRYGAPQAGERERERLPNLCLRPARPCRALLHVMLRYGAPQARGCHNQSLRPAGLCCAYSMS